MSVPRILSNTNTQAHEHHYRPPSLHAEDFEGPRRVARQAVGPQTAREGDLHTATARCRTHLKRRHPQHRHRHRSVCLESGERERACCGPGGEESIHGVCLGRVEHVDGAGLGRRTGGRQLQLGVLDSKRFRGENSFSVHAQPVTHGQQSLRHRGDDGAVGRRTHVQR